MSDASTVSSSAAAPAAVASGPILINGTETSKKIKEELTIAVANLKSSFKLQPVLAVILVGSRKDSQSYVTSKTKTCKEIGMESQQFNLAENTSQEELMQLVQKLNDDPQVSGILVQLPLPAHLNSDLVIAAINPKKDVDGLTTSSQGYILQQGMKAPLIPCTPLGCIELLDRYHVPIAGAHAVVVGRSALVGKPVAQLLLSRDATVTMCHSRTKTLSAILSTADIVIAAMGKADFIQGAWLKKGCVVIDVGINAVDDATKKAGYRLVGDVHFASASAVASQITPVPGGVGPMTVVMLMKNTLKAACLQHGIEISKVLGADK